MWRRTVSLPLALHLTVLLVLLTVPAAAQDRLTAGGPAPLVDCVEAEHNNTPDSPNAFPFPGSCVGSAAFEDPNGGWFFNYPDGTTHFVHDFWSVDLTVATAIDVTLTFAAGANLDLVITNETLSTTRGFSLSPTNTVEHVSTGTLQPGRHLIAVLALSGGSAYTLSVSLPGSGTAPTAPSNLTAIALSQTAIRLSWADNSANETEFRIERRSVAGSYVDVGSTAAGITSFVAEGLAPATLYTFRVKARNASGDSLYSNEASATTAGSTTACASDAITLCLNGGRFRVRVNWQTETGQVGNGMAVPLTNDTGYFWFFTSANVELVVKALNACFPPYNNYWVFAGGLTDVLVVMTVTDTKTGAVETYVNPQKTPFAPIQDTAHFKASCP